MKRIIIICEGQTEQAFCNDILNPYFSLKDIFIENPTIKKTNGGIVNWSALKHQIVDLHLKKDKTAFITTFIDYYGIYAHHKFPNWLESQKLIIKNDAIDLIEKGMKGDLEIDYQHRFIPYIQLHEFEGLLFSDIQVYENSFEPNEFLDKEYLVETINEFANPEMINSGIESAPSKRLSKILKSYFSENENSKVIFGSLLANDIGLEKIRSKCPRFDAWITQLETI